MLYSFAGLIIDIRFRYGFGKKQCEKYRYEGNKPADFIVEITDEMIKKEREFDPHGSTEEYLESIAAYRYICEKAYDYGCMFMHCSSIAYKGNGILFTAPSGTGKSTHSSLWKRHFGDDVIVVNDDKPLLRFENDKIYACGTPWDGKHHQSTNIMVPVKAIVVISQSRQNAIQRASKQEALYHILNQTLRPEQVAVMDKVLGFTEQLIKNIPCYKLGCNISDEAVMTAYEALKENFDEN